MSEVDEIKQFTDTMDISRRQVCISCGSHGPMFDRFIKRGSFVSAIKDNYFLKGGGGGRLISVIYGMLDSVQNEFSHSNDFTLF